MLFVIRILPAEEFGKYGIAFAYINLLAALTRGLWVIPLITSAARGESALVLGPVFWLSMSSAIVAGGSALIVLPALGLESTLPILSAMILLFTVPRELGYALSQSSGRYGITALIEAVYFLGSLITYAVLYFSGALNSAVMALSVNLVCIALSALTAVLIYPRILRPSIVGDWKGVISSGKWMGIMGLSDVYIQQGDAVLLGALVRPAELAPFLAARTLLRLYTLFSQAINFLTLPVASRLGAVGHLKKLRLKVVSVLKILLISFFLINIIVWFASPFVLPWLLGERYVTAVPYFLMLLPITLFEPIYSICANALTGMGRPDVVAKFIPWAVPLNITANLVLVSAFGLKMAPPVLLSSYVFLAVGLIFLSRRLLVDNEDWRNRETSTVSNPIP